MSAFAYINMTDVPMGLIATSAQHLDEITHDPLIGFDGCPLVGRTVLTQAGAQVEYPFPRNPQIRNDLVSWFVDKGINFTVVM